MHLRLPHYFLKSGHHRLYSASVTNPCLKKDLFSKRPIPSNVLDLPLNCYPNPLLTLEKDEILELKDQELNHLLSIPGGSPAELENLFLNVVLIINDTLIADTPKAALYLEKFEKSHFELPITALLRESYKNNRLRRSIVSFLEDPTDEETRFDIGQVITDLAQRKQCASKEKTQILLNYLQKLSCVRRINMKCIYLPLLVLDLLLKELSALDKRNLFSYLVHANIKFEQKDHYNELKLSLLQSAPLSKLVARTGLKDPKWHDLAKTDFDDLHKQRIVEFYSFNELKSFAHQALREKNFFDSNLYLELIVTKFELFSNNKHLQDVLEIMLLHSMILKGPQECIRFFRYNVETGVKIETRTLLKVLEKFREEGLLDEALFLVNYLHKENLLPSQRQKLTSEIMLVMRKKFVNHPQIVVGYFAALFNNENKEALQLLHDLKLLDIFYCADGENIDISVIKEAVLHEDLKGSKLNHDVLFQMYSFALASLPLKVSTNPLFIRNLYDAYIMKVNSAMSENDNTSLFHEENLGENIISLFVEYLLRTHPHDPNSMILSTEVLKYDTAKYVVNDFFNVANVKWIRKKTYLIDLLIYSSLMKHNDFAFAMEMLKRARSTNLPVTFNQIYPFITYHLLRNEEEKALQWYEIIVQNGVKARSTAAYDLFKTAKDLNWPVKGSQYISSVRQRNKKIRENLQHVSSDPMDLLPMNSTSSSQRFEIIEELASVLNLVSSDKSQS